MTDITLRDVDDVLLDRIGRVSRRCGWDTSTTLMHLLEQGLHTYEGNGTTRFDGSEADVLLSAMHALEEIPDDPGFAMIGRLPGGGGADGED